jgi:hypothetical protein
MMPPSACQHWQTEQAANAAREQRSYTTPWGTILDDDVQAADLIQEYEAKIAALERMVGRQALEIELLKGALKHAPRPRSASTSVVTGPAGSPLAGGAS